MYSLGRIRWILFLLALTGLVATAAASSYIQVFTHPGGGTVCMDDTCEVSVGTPNGYSSTQFQDLTCGRDHALRIYGTAGYEDYSDDVYMAYNCNSVTRRVFLEPLPATPAPQGSGDIQLFISPGTGMVCRDDVECESASGGTVDTWSVRFSDVTPNEAHKITVSADGYQPYLTQATVPPGGITNVEIALQPVTAADATAPPQPAATKAASMVFVPAAAAMIAGMVFLSRRDIP
jgi:hypothetical protein